uniref:SAP domain-containing protein n=1 Tax=Araucaria cunninghamii TaxID=56994 RepID=A0A0D6R590_ARACU
MAEQFLGDLPSRGCFITSFTPLNPDCLKPYICDHDTTPPEDQVIKTDATNILIRSLTLKRGKAEPKPKDNKRKSVADTVKSKRPAEKPLEDRATSKRPNSTTSPSSSKKEGSSSRLSEKDLQSFTVEKLRSLLKEKGLPTKGKKDELIARLR